MPLLFKAMPAFFARAFNRPRRRAIIGDAQLKLMSLMGALLRHDANVLAASHGRDRRRFKRASARASEDPAPPQSSARAAAAPGLAR